MIVAVFRFLALTQLLNPLSGRLIAGHASFRSRAFLKPAIDPRSNILESRADKLSDQTRKRSTGEARVTFRVRVTHASVLGG